MLSTRNELPLISIIMPVYMVENFIAKSIMSVIRQTYRNIELILVNDGTKDDSLKVAEKTLNFSSMYYTIINQENKGVGEARNTGINSSKGEWICFLDSDDLLSDNAIEHLIDAAISHNTDIVFSGINEITNIDEAIKKCDRGTATRYSQPEIQERFLLRTRVILAPGTLYRKQFLDDNNIRFERMRWSEDQHFVWRTLFYLSGATFLDEPLYQYYRHSNSIMGRTEPDIICDSYEKIRQLETLYKDVSDVGPFIVPRWVMGTLNATTLMMDFKLWRTLSKKIQLKASFRVLLYFPAAETKIMAFLGLAFPYMYYYLNRLRKTIGKGKLRKRH